MKLSSIKTWGIDINNVILLDLSESLFYKRDDYSSEEISHYIKIIPGALNGIQTLIKRVGNENVWLLTKADDKQKKTIKLALEKLRFYEKTSLKRDQIIFFSEENDKKTIIRSLELEALIDHQGHSIFSVQKFVKHPFWFLPNKLDVEIWVHKLNSSVRVISGWKQFIEMFNN